jgi:hypothetical protein
MFFAPLITLLLIALAFGTVPYYRNFKKLSGKIHFNHLLNNKSSVLRELFNQRDHVSKNIMELLNKHPLDL